MNSIRKWTCLHVITFGARVRGTVIILCVYLLLCYIHVHVTVLYVENKVPLGFLLYFQDMNFFEKALFKSCGDIC